MNHIFKSIYLTLIFVLSLNSLFCQERHELELKLDSNGKLVDPRTPNIERRDTISWVIKDSNISTFSIKRNGRGNIFTTRPERDQASQLELVVARLAKPFGGEWEYTIQWTGRDNQKFDHDPKIAVKPILGFSGLILILAFIFTSITAFVFYNKWQNAEKLLKNRPQNP